MIFIYVPGTYVIMRRKNFAAFLIYYVFFKISYYSLLLDFRLL